MTTSRNVEELLGKSPMDLLHTSTNALPGFGTYAWVLTAAIFDTTRVGEEESSRGLLLVKRKESRRKPEGQWELLKGEVQGNDRDVKSALTRMVAEKTGLQVKAIDGGFEKVQVMPATANMALHVKLHFVVDIGVDINDFTTVKSLFDMMRLGHEYSQSTWVLTKDEINSLATRKGGMFPPYQMKLAFKAFDFRLEPVHSTMDYLIMAPEDLPYKDRYRWMVIAAILRPDDTLPTAIMVIERGGSKYGAGNWELAGGNVDTTCETLEAALKVKIKLETGLIAREILGSINGEPTLLPSTRSDLGLAILDYVVTVDAGEVSLKEDYDAWRWVENVEEAKTLQMSKAGFKKIGDALEAAKKYCGDVHDKGETKAGAEERPGSHVVEGLL